jgi:hypothetical protein
LANTQNPMSNEGTVPERVRLGLDSSSSSKSHDIK